MRASVSTVLKKSPEKNGGMRGVGVFINENSFLMF